MALSHIMTHRVTAVVTETSTNLYRAWQWHHTVLSSSKVLVLDDNNK